MHNKLPESIAHDTCHYLPAVLQALLHLTLNRMSWKAIKFAGWMTRNRVINECPMASWSPRSIGERMSSRHNALYPQAGPSQDRNSVPARSSSRLRHDANLADNLSRALVEVSMTYDDEENEEEEVQKYAGKGKRRV
ncbi:hypothetical protein EUX98_g5628 [Antrodiella citrinella]|uniref:Uncharacterized protein n=1 Tax=Antrodiella citrinella TaxID=2447956 RepID=A0A4S4MRA9_9APHY|nr:hypothetical protein EUX98_g5628 [Antrodiella citrinella]